jgi:hypothetical protein
MDSNTTDYVQCIYGADSNNSSKDIYIDSIVGTGTIQTEILYLDDEGYSLKNANTYETVLSVSTVRPSGYTSCDIDNDGVVEIPTVSVFKGYESLPDTEQVKMTSWLCYQNKSLITKYYGYYSINDGYFFAIPERWKDRVTIKLDNSRNDVVFYEYDGDLESSTRELLRLTVSTKEEYSDIQSSGYQLMRTNGSNYYLAKVNDSIDSDLKISLAEVLFNLMCRS